MLKRWSAWSSQSNRSPGDTLPSSLLLLLICLVGFAFRVWGIDYGLPHEGMTYTQLTFEESKEVHRAFKLGIGEYVWSFGKGGMYWILFFQFGIYYVVSLVFGWVSSPQEFAMQVLEDRTTAYMIGRITVAFMGVLTCAVIYWLGKRLFDQRTGLIAAFIGAVTYHHVQSSSVINVDIGLVLFGWASVLCYVAYEQSRRIRWLVASGALAGIAIAFKLPAVLIVGWLCIAILTAPETKISSRRLVREGITFFLALISALTIIAPEWTLWASRIVLDTFASVGGSLAHAGNDDALDAEIYILSQYRPGFSLGYLRHFAKDYNLALVVAALFAFLIGIWRKQRWDILLGLFVVGFVFVISLHSRPTAERYLLPVLPALWLLGGRAVAFLTDRHRLLLPIALTVIVAMPIVNLARAGVERSHPDTRLIAKSWIESNVPAGAKILMDGFQHRYIVSPPLLPDESTIERQVGRVATQVERGRQIGRGVNEVTLSLYQEAISQAPGPRYELHSTMHGLALESPDYYIENCFDYVVTSSSIVNRYAPGRVGHERHPESVYFYEQLNTNPRFNQIYQVGPVPWQSNGPTITVYEIDNACPDSM
jgi:4-amino-4-deoxy-L-arabinose transferase-like glycosyltransferase